MSININEFNSLIQRLKQDTSNHKLWIDLGFMYNNQEKTKQSLECFNIAKDLSPLDPECMYALGYFNYYQGKYNDAKSNYLLSIKLAYGDPFQKNIPLIMYYIGLCELALGNKKDWLLMNEYRPKQALKDFYKVCDESTTKYIHNLKEINSINEIQKDTKLLVLSEQGFGDQIMYARYLRELKKYSKFITFQTHSATFNLFKNCEDLKNISVKNKILKKEVSTFDYKIFLLSLPSLLNDFKKKWPKPLNLSSKEFYCYLNGSQKKSLKNFLQNHVNSNKLNVGICWKGRREFTENNRRSVKLGDLKKLFTKDINFFSLQKDTSESEKKIISKFENFFNLENYINNFTDMAIITELMDVIITICSAPAHLAGSINKKTFLLLDKNHSPQWNEFETNKLYYNFTILKQKSCYSWKAPINNLRDLIKEESRIKLLKKPIISYRSHQRRLA